MMFRKVLMLMVAVLFFSACEVHADVIHSSWVGEDGGWGEASNWDPAIVPDNNPFQTFSVTIDGGSGEKTDVSLVLSRTIDQLTTYGNVWISSRSSDWIELDLEDANGLTNYGELRIRGGPYNEVAQFKVRGPVQNEPGAHLDLFGVKTGYGSFYNSPGAIVDVKYENSLRGIVINEGEIMLSVCSEMGSEYNITNRGLLYMFGGVCASNSELINDINGTIEGVGIVHGDNLLENKGKVFASGGALLLHSDSLLLNSGILANKTGSILHLKMGVEDFTNYGEIIVNTNGSITVELKQVFGEPNDCTLNNEPNGTIQLRGGILSGAKIIQKAGAKFEGFGGITGDLVIEANGVIDVNGPTNIVGDVQIEPNATLEIRDGTTLIRGQTTCNNGTIHMIGGRVICQGGLSNNGCNIIWEPGIYTNIADFNLDGHVNFKDFGDFANTWLWRASWY